jgi:sucrose synthase
MAEPAADELGEVPLDPLTESLSGERGPSHRLLHALLSQGRPFLLPSDIADALAPVCADDPRMGASALALALRQCQEVALDHAWVYLARRHAPGAWDYLRIHVETMDLQRVDADGYLAFKEHLVAGLPDDPFALRIDLSPFFPPRPMSDAPASIAAGADRLNRDLTARLFGDDEGDSAGLQRLLGFLRGHHCRGRPLLVASTIQSISDLRAALRKALIPLRSRASHTPSAELDAELRALGLEPGWGADALSARESIELLLELLEAPDAELLARFLDRIPMLFSIAVLAPQGWLGQSNVLGRPDAGGRVVYILDQVRALEQAMRRRLDEQGLSAEPAILVVTRLIPEALGTSADEPSEPIAGTRNARILRIPFRDADGEVVSHWVSRFQLWPYLEGFAVDAERELLAELGGVPDLVIGHGADGGLMATLMARRLGVSHCQIAHVLEKSRFLFSDLYWRDHEPAHHFSCQYSADLIAMNRADFIVTHTAHEIAGSDKGVGQYEGYRQFTLPGLFRVLAGVDIHDRRFNVVPPGVDSGVYFSHRDRDRRLSHLHDEIAELIDGGERPQARGVLAEPDRPLLFTLARPERIKNITGLVDWYGRCPRLQEQVNLLIVGGTLDPAMAGDDDEREQVQHLHALLERHRLDGRVRWLGLQLDRPLAGELYRVVADRRGAYVQPALFEAFGLTIIEAMASGLPTFATCYGGAAEIIDDGVSGFLIDPVHGPKAAERIADFFQSCEAEQALWSRISKAAIDRVAERYDWTHHAERLLSVAQVYGFWKPVNDIDRRELRAYLDTLYALLLRPRMGNRRPAGAAGI